MNARKRIAIGICTVTLAAGLGGGTGTAAAAPAQATVKASCPSGALCLWQDSDFRGRRLVFRDTGYWQYLNRYGFSHSVSSYWNRRGDDAAFLSHSGRKICIDGSERNGRMGGWNDQVKAVYLARTGSNC
ncbi:peptidase inhibitor family I36 protein [Streptomyces sclerotialus]|uniref:peptidase inhibitor family I36 protein n=1 Tax=Streptomyces sclerotialus TaxID=1957 RepID=UPI0004C86CBA